jgi:peptidoglycan/LPS O-acetylase OafA/YrhL
MRIEALTFPRFLAAFVVVTFHFAKDTAFVRVLPGFFSAGPEMVTFFFVLSGFVMTVAHWNRPDESPGRFYVARLARILPAYFVALTATCFVVPGSIDTKALLAHSVLAQAWFPGLTVSLNVPAWSISVEMFFYLLFPFLFFVARHDSWRSFHLLLGASFCWALTQLVEIYLFNSTQLQPHRSLTHELIHYNPLSHLSSFMLGMSGAHWLIRRRSSLNTCKWTPLAAIVVSLVACAIVTYRLTIVGATGLFIPTGGSLLAPVFLAVILTLAICEGFLKRLLSNRVLVLLGEASYSLYILQYPIYNACVRGILPEGPVTDGGFFLFFAILLVTSILSFLFLERPVRRLIIGFSARIAHSR